MKLNLDSLRRDDDGVQHILIVGASKRAEHLVEEITGKRVTGCAIEGFVDDDPERRTALETLGVRYLGTIDALDRLMCEQVIDSVYVCLPLRSSYDIAQRILTLCEEAGVRVYMVTDLLPQRTRPGAMWCMAPLYAEDAVERPQRESPFTLESLRGGALTPLLTALTAVFFGLISGSLLFSQ